MWLSSLFRGSIIGLIGGEGRAVAAAVEEGEGDELLGFFEAVGNSGEQAELFVGRFDQCVREVMQERCFDPCYWWELSMRQVEVSRTLVFDDPRRARTFFEALVEDNIDIGRPAEVAMVFARPLRRPTKHPYRTRVFGPGTDVKIDFSYKHSRVKQYLKEGRVA